MSLAGVLAVLLGGSLVSGRQCRHSPGLMTPVWPQRHGFIGFGWSMLHWRLCRRHAVPTGCCYGPAALPFSGTWSASAPLTPSSSGPTSNTTLQIPYLPLKSSSRTSRCFLVRGPRPSFRGRWLLLWRLHRWPLFYLSIIPLVLAPVPSVITSRLLTLVFVCGLFSLWRQCACCFTDSRFVC